MTHHLVKFKEISFELFRGRLSNPYRIQKITITLKFNNCINFV